MPYFNERSPAMNLTAEAIQRCSSLLFELFQFNSKNFLSTIEDLSILCANKEPQHDHTNDDSSFFNLLTYTIESKAYKHEFLRKYELVKFLNSLKVDPQISTEDFERFCTLIQLSQDSYSQDFIMSVIEADLPTVIINKLMSIIPGYLFINEALPQSIINIYLPENFKNEESIKNFSILDLKALTTDIASQINESLIFDFSAHSITESEASTKDKPATTIQKKGVRRKLNFDIVSDNEKIQEPIQHSENHNNDASNSNPTPKNWSLKARKAYLQLSLFKYIASDTRVMEKSDGKLFSKSQEAIEKICTLISNYAEPKIKSSYEDQNGFKIDKYAKFHLNFWKNISINRHLKTLLSKQISERLSNFDETTRYLCQLIHRDYDEIPNASTSQDSNVTNQKIDKSF